LVNDKTLTKKKVAAALISGGISWGWTATTDATAASARARRSRQGVVIYPLFRLLVTAGLAKKAKEYINKSSLHSFLLVDVG
jgi:hypothetical protein